MPDNTTHILERIAAFCEQIASNTAKMEKYLETLVEYQQ